MILMSWARNHGPNQPCAPKISTKTNPATTGETEKGRSISVSSRLLPGKRNLVIAQAAAMPNSRFAGTQIAATSNVSWIAATVSGSLIACR